LTVEQVKPLYSRKYLYKSSLAGATAETHLVSRQLRKVGYVRLRWL